MTKTISRVLFLLLLFCLLPISVIASNKPTLVVLVDINCEFCKELHNADHEIIYLAGRAGINVVYAPIPNDADTTTAWAEKTYYACYKDKLCDSRRLLGILYEAQDFNRLDMKADVDMWLDMRYPDARMHKYQNIAHEYEESVKRMIGLAGVVRIKQFPTFAVVGDRDLNPYQIASSTEDTLVQRVNIVQSWLKNRDNL